MQQTQPIGFPNPVVFSQLTPIPAGQGIHYYQMQSGILLYQSPTLSPVAASVVGVQEWQINGLRMWHIATPAEVAGAGFGGLGRRRVITVVNDEDMRDLMTILLLSGILDE